MEGRNQNEGKIREANNASRGDGCWGNGNMSAGRVKVGDIRRKARYEAACGRVVKQGRETGHREKWGSPIPGCVLGVPESTAENERTVGGISVRRNGWFS